MGRMLTASYLARTTARGSPISMAATATVSARHPVRPPSSQRGARDLVLVD